MKYDNFIKDTDGQFKRTEVMHFDIIHWQVRGETIDQNLVKKYKIIHNSMVNVYPKKEKDLALSSASREKIYFLKKI